MSSLYLKIQDYTNMCIAIVFDKIQYECYQIWRMEDVRQPFRVNADYIETRSI